MEFCCKRVGGGSLNVCRLFKIERKHNHLRPCFAYGFGIGYHGFVLDVVRMVYIYRVGQPVHEFEFRTEFEEREVEVASQAGFKKDIVALEFEIIVSVT